MVPAVKLERFSCCLFISGLVTVGSFKLLPLSFWDVYRRGFPVKSLLFKFHLSERGFLSVRKNLYSFKYSSDWNEQQKKPGI